MRSSPLYSLFPARCPARVRLIRVLLGRRPFLHSFLQPSLVFVRLLRRYYAAARLPIAVHPGLIAHRLHPAVRVVPTTGSNGASRFSHVKFLCMRGVFDSAGSGALALTHAGSCSSGFVDTVDSLICLFRSSQLRDTQPTYAPVQRFEKSVTASLAWLGVRMVATPFLYDSFIHYFTPVYPDAFRQRRTVPDRSLAYRSDYLADDHSHRPLISIRLLAPLPP